VSLTGIVTAGWIRKFDDVAVAENPEIVLVPNPAMP
jgi:hypothetical protein